MPGVVMIIIMGRVPVMVVKSKNDRCRSYGYWSARLHYDSTWMMSASMVATIMDNASRSKESG